MTIEIEIRVTHWSEEEKEEKGRKERKGREELTVYEAYKLQFH